MYRALTQWLRSRFGIGQTEELNLLHFSASSCHNASMIAVFTVNNDILISSMSWWEQGTQKRPGISITFGSSKTDDKLAGKICDCRNTCKLATHLTLFPMIWCSQNCTIWFSWSPDQHWPATHFTNKSSFKFYVNFILLSSKFYWTDHHRILHMARQLCCGAMCKNLLWYNR